MASVSNSMPRIVRPVAGPSVLSSAMTTPTFMHACLKAERLKLRCWLFDGPIHSNASATDEKMSGAERRPKGSIASTK